MVNHENLFSYHVLVRVLVGMLWVKSLWQNLTELVNVRTYVWNKKELQKYGVRPRISFKTVF